MAADAGEEIDVESDGDAIVATVGEHTVEADWQTMKRLGERLLRESDNHKTDLQKAEEINGAHFRFSCECCDYEEEFEYASDLRDRGLTAEEHADFEDYDCTKEDVTIEAFCPRHGVIPLAYDECDGCADARNHMNR